MRLGLSQVFQSFGYDTSVSDGQVFAEELQLAILAEQLGFDAVWPVEHHFHDYAFCPDNVTYLSHLAALTQRINLATGAIILPWRNPLRVTEQIAMLDHLSRGRVSLGMGRGLARTDYELMGIDMDSARGRFDEAAPMILDALETGTYQGNGPYYAHAPTPIRPRPATSFADRKCLVGMSPDSADTAARLGARLMMFLYKPVEEVAKDINTYRDKYREYHDAEPPRPILAQFVYCDRDPVKADELGRQYLTQYLHSCIQHYEFSSDHLLTTKGYESYGTTVKLMQDVGLEEFRDLYLRVQVYGSPQQIVERTQAFLEVVGPFDLNLGFRFAGLSVEHASASMRTFAEDAMPLLRNL